MNSEKLGLNRSFYFFPLLYVILYLFFQKCRCCLLRNESRQSEGRGSQYSRKTRTRSRHPGPQLAPSLGPPGRGALTCGRVSVSQSQAPVLTAGAAVGCRRDCEPASASGGRGRRPCLKPGHCLAGGGFRPLLGAQVPFLLPLWPLRPRFWSFHPHVSVFSPHCLAEELV